MFWENTLKEKLILCSVVLVLSTSSLAVLNREKNKTLGLKWEGEILTLNVSIRSGTDLAGVFMEISAFDAVHNFVLRDNEISYMMHNNNKQYIPPTNTLKRVPDSIRNELRKILRDGPELTLWNLGLLGRVFDFKKDSKKYFVDFVLCDAVDLFVLRKFRNGEELEFWYDSNNLIISRSLPQCIKKRLQTIFN